MGIAGVLQLGLFVPATMRNAEPRATPSALCAARDITAAAATVSDAHSSLQSALNAALNSASPATTVLYAQTALECCLHTVWGFATTPASMPGAEAATQTMLRAAWKLTTPPTSVEFARSETSIPPLTMFVGAQTVQCVRAAVAVVVLGCQGAASHKAHAVRRRLKRQCCYFARFLQRRVRMLRASAGV